MDPSALHRAVNGTASTRKYALIVEHPQNDLVHPEGAIAGDDYRHIIAPINELLRYPGFDYKIATLTNAPDDHVMFASSHSDGKVNDDLHHKNPKGGKGHETVKSFLQKSHSKRGSWGNTFTSDFQREHVDLVVKKFGHRDVITYSSFTDLHGNRHHELPEGALSHDLEHELKQRGITDVFIVGIGGEFCVLHTALDLIKLGMRAYVVEDAVGFHGPKEDLWPDAKKQMLEAGVKVIDIGDPELDALKKA